MATFNRRSFLFEIAGGAALLALPRWAQAADATRPPNIIFVLADDLGLSRVSCYGADMFQTPQMDKLAATGLKFERAYSMPLCGPTRAALLTGQYPFRTGATVNAKSVLDGQNPMPFTRRLQQAGYSTICIGKLGQVAKENDLQAPARLGFDEYMLWMGRATPDRYWIPKYYRNGEIVQGGPDQYGPDLTQAFLVDFMRRHKDQPFFAFYSAVLTHFPFVRTPDSKDDNHLVPDMVAYFDKQMGQLAASLDELGLRDNTILIITSDNGPDGKPLGTIEGQAMIGKKDSPCEGGVREPFIVNCPGRVPAGKVCPDLTDITDIYPTVLELAGIQSPADMVLDGHSIAPQILGRAGQPRNWVYAQVREEYFIANHHYKLYGNGKFVDITDSPVAEKPVPRGNQEAGAVKAQMKQELDKLRTGFASPDLSVRKRKK